MYWRFVDDEKWRDIYVALIGDGVESMQGKWDEMYAAREYLSPEPINVKKPRKKATTKKTPKKKSVVTKKTVVRKPKVTAKKSTTKKKTTDAK